MDIAEPARARPERVELIGEELAVRWEDGHESYYPSALLREHCPCATCKSVREKEGLQRQRQPAQPANPLRVFAPGEIALSNVKIIGYEPVGRYALRLFTSDRHDTGIYDFRLLRGICPCGACR